MTTRTRVVTVADVEAASAFIAVGPGDVVTPSARDRARELGVEFGPAADATAGLSPTPARRPEVVTAIDPPVSGALYRRGSPVPAPTAARRGGQVAVVGAGHVGAMTALRLAERDRFERIVLVDVAPGLAAGLALDMWHAASLRHFATRIDGSEDIGAIAGSDYVVITAGRPRQPGMSRTDLTAVNAEIVRSVASAVRTLAPDAVVVVVTNPLEEMTHLAEQASGFPPNRVVGMAGVLDSARFCSLVGLAADVEPGDVSAYALGSHGPEMVIPLSHAYAGSRSVRDVIAADRLDAIVERTRDSGAEVVALLKTGSAYFAPAESTARMVMAMATGAAETLTVCVRSQGCYGLVDTRVGLPARLGPRGIEEVIELTLEPPELEALRQAAKRIAARIAELG